MESTWTMRDLAELTRKAVLIALADDMEYCEHCDVALIPTGDKYCDGCVNELVEYLAVEYKETLACQEGLY